VELEKLLTELETSPEKGLTSQEAQERLRKFGLNYIPEKEETLLHRIARRFWGPIPWMIEVAALLSAMVKKWEDFGIILTLLVVNAAVDFWQEHKALSALKVLKEKLSKKALVLRDGRWLEVDAKFIVPGDIVKLRVGNIVPADGAVIRTDGHFQVDQSSLTGESLPVSKGRGDELYANSVVKTGEAIAVVTKTGTQTYFGKAVQLVARAEAEQRSHFQEMVIKVGNFLIVVALVVVTTMTIVELIRGAEKLELLRFALVLTVASIPVALPAVLTVTMAIGALSLARRQVVVSRLSSIEELAGVDVLCCDKTGTLTQNRMTVHKPFTAKGYTEEELMLYACLASREENKDPLEVPIFEWLREKGAYERLKSYKLLRFVPFDPARKSSEATVEGDGERFTVIKGAPQVVVPKEEEELQEKVEEFARNGFRTIAVAIERQGKGREVVGLIPLFDPPREDSRKAVEEARKLGVEVKMVTGDNSAIARYMAMLLGVGKKVLSVRELKGKDYKEYTFLARLIAKALLLSKGLSREEAEEKAGEVARIVEDELERLELPRTGLKRHESEIIEIIEKANGFAEVLPEDKYMIVDKLQKAGHIVGMTGDGVNDAPALRRADCGIAVYGATDSARASADLVLLKPGLSVIIDAFKIARQIFGRMQAYTIYRIAETIRIVGFLGLSIIFFHFYPLTPVMIIVLALLNDIPIISIAYDRVRTSPKPVRWDMYEINVMSFYLGFAGLVSSFVMLFLLFSYWKLPIDLIQSIVFLKLAVKGHGTLYNARIMDHLWKKPWPSPVLWLATYSTRVAGTIIGVYGFGIMTPTGWGWAMFIWGYALAWLLINDYVKLFVWKMYKEKKLMFEPGHFKALRRIFSA